MLSITPIECITFAKFFVAFFPSSSIVPVLIVNYDLCYLEADKVTCSSNGTSTFLSFASVAKHTPPIHSQETRTEVSDYD